MSNAEAWVKAQRNSALQTERDVDEALRHSDLLDIPIHPCRWKNWDNYMAVHLAGKTLRYDRILDAGACRDSVFLPALRRQGHEGDLISINLDEPKPEIVDGITYENGDITRTRFNAKDFGFIACLSVIEHGVDPTKFLDESARILRHGGQLFVSFDYWGAQIDTKGMMAFGAPIRMFNAIDVLSIIAYAQSIGLRATSVPSLACRDPLVKWMGFEYTFCNLHFVKA